MNFFTCDIAITFSGYLAQQKLFKFNFWCRNYKIELHLPNKEHAACMKILRKCVRFSVLPVKNVGQAVNFRGEW